jgi:hypothetical protein
VIVIRSSIKPYWLDAAMVRESPVEDVRMPA